MADIVKPLKIESPSSGGTETDYLPTESDPSEDYLAGKGLSYEGLDTYLAEKIGRVLTTKIPDDSIKVTYNAAGDVETVETFITSTQITTNRLSKTTVAYDVDLNPTSETLEIYDTDGTTVLRTVTFTYSITDFDLDTAEMSIT